MALFAGALTPARLLALFCAMNMLVYIDRGACAWYFATTCIMQLVAHSVTTSAGVIASNGVNGDKATVEHAAYGIVVCRAMSERS